MGSAAQVGRTAAMDEMAAAEGWTIVIRHAEIYICWKTAYGYDDEHGHDDVHAFCDVHMLLAIVLRCFETNLIFTNGSEDASRFFIALRLALRGKTQRR